MLYPLVILINWPSPIDTLLIPLTEMDRLLVKACSPVMTKSCRHLVENHMEDEGRMMDCLIEHKNAVEMNEKCKSGVLHYQLISLREVDVFCFVNGGGGSGILQGIFDVIARYRFLCVVLQQLWVDSIFYADRPSFADPPSLKACQTDVIVLNVAGGHGFCE